MEDVSYNNYHDLLYDRILPVIEPVSGDIPENFAEKTQIVW